MSELKELNHHRPPGAIGPVGLQRLTWYATAYAAALVMLALLAGCQSTPERVLVRLNDSVGFAYGQIANARDAGLITQAEWDRHKPIADGIDAALDEAGEAVRAGDASGFEVAKRAVYAGMAKLRPLLEKAKKAPPTTRPATRPA